jgi:hypothetical protein
MCWEGVTVFYKESGPHNIAHYVFYGKKFISSVQWLALSDMFRLYSFKLKKIGESDHGLAQEFYLPEMNWGKQWKTQSWSLVSGIKPRNQPQHLVPTKPSNQTSINGENQPLKCWVVDVLTIKNLFLCKFWGSPASPAVVLNIKIFWDVTQIQLVNCYQQDVRTCCLYLQGLVSPK